MPRLVDISRIVKRGGHKKLRQLLNSSFAVYYFVPLFVCIDSFVSSNVQRASSIYLEKKKEKIRFFFFDKYGFVVIIGEFSLDKGDIIYRKIYFA